jgi:hypothetical protein
MVVVVVDETRRIEEKRDTNFEIQHAISRVPSVFVDPERFPDPKKQT